jgi:H+/Cl- antiporter ClcA
MSIGAASGFAAAFGAPIGGVLFALEEASSWWSHKLMWRALTSTSLATVTVHLLQSDKFDFKVFGLISLSTGDNVPSFYADALIPLTIVGCLGGVLGALFNSAYEVAATKKWLRWVQHGALLVWWHAEKGGTYGRESVFGLMPPVTLTCFLLILSVSSSSRALALFVCLLTPLPFSFAFSRLCPFRTTPLSFLAVLAPLCSSQPRHLQGQLDPQSAHGHIHFRPDFYCLFLGVVVRGWGARLGLPP